MSEESEATDRLAKAVENASSSISGGLIFLGAAVIIGCLLMGACTINRNNNSREIRSGLESIASSIDGTKVWDENNVQAIRSIGQAIDRLDSR